MNHTHTIQDLRKFGLLTGAIFVGLFGLLIPILKAHAMPTWPWWLAVSLWLPAMIYPKALKVVYRLWITFGEILGAINSRIILGILFFLIITPIGLIRRTFGKDLMGKHYDPALKSYRTPITPKPITHMEKPF